MSHREAKKAPRLRTRVNNQINTCSINMKMQTNKQDKNGGLTYDDA